MDYVIDANGRKLISLCKSISHVITNGRIGQFTSRGQCHGLFVNTYS